MSDYMTDEEQLHRLREWWQKHGVSLLVGVVLAVAGVLGWRWYQGHVEARTSAASDLYVQFQQADADEREALAERIIEQGEGTAYPAFVRLAEAEAALGAEGPEAAEPLLRQAVELATGVELADTARLRLARVLFAAGREDEALAVLRDITSPGFRSLAAELQGDIHLARNERSLAHQSYTRALSYASPGEKRPVLEMKIADTADASDS